MTNKEQNLLKEITDLKEKIGNLDEENETYKLKVVDLTTKSLKMNADCNENDIIKNFHQRLKSISKEKETLEKNMSNEMKESEKLRKIISDQADNIKKSESKASEKWSKYKKNLELLEISVTKEKQNYEKTIMNLKDEIKKNKIKSMEDYNESVKSYRTKQKGMAEFTSNCQAFIFGI